MADKYEQLDFSVKGLVISAEDADDIQQYKRAKAIAEERGLPLSIATRKPVPWQPPENSYVISKADAAGSTEKYREAKAEAEKRGLQLVIAPDGFAGPAVNGSWVPPEGKIVVPHNATDAQFHEACEVARRLGREWVLEPEPANPLEVIKPGQAISIPRSASPQEYKRLKKLATDNKVPYRVGA
jgi:hypothetical protein